MQAAVIAMALRNFSNDDLAAFNNAIHTFGRVSHYNRSYPSALEANLITVYGTPTFDLAPTRDAAVFEVNRRVNEGTFV